MRWFLLPFLFAFAACDPGTATGPGSTATASPAAMKTTDSETFQITNEASVTTYGDVVVLEVGDQRIELPAGEGYVISQALARASFDALDDGIKKQFPGYEPGEDDDGYPRAGDGAILYEGLIIFGPGRRPPLPPPPDWDPGFLEALLQGSAEVIEIPKGTDFEPVSGGWIQRQ